VFFLQQSFTNQLVRCELGIVFGAHLTLSKDAAFHLGVWAHQGDIHRTERDGVGCYPNITFFFTEKLLLCQHLKKSFKEKATIGLEQ
jgi:hypothetical protein